MAGLFSAALALGGAMLPAASAHAGCGDGVVEPLEACDDGAALNGTPDHCTTACNGQCMEQFSWSSRVGGIGNDSGNTLAVAPDGTIYLAGEQADGTTLYIERRSADGITVPWSVQVTATGGSIRPFEINYQSASYYVVGTLAGSANFVGIGTVATGGEEQAFVLKGNAATGAFQWVRLLQATGRSRGLGIAVGSVGEVYVTGDYQGTHSISQSSPCAACLAGSPCTLPDTVNIEDIFVARLDASGCFDWTSSYGTPGLAYDSDNDIAVTTGGEIYATGMVAVGTSPPLLSENLILARVNPLTGNINPVTVAGSVSTFETGIELELVAGDSNSLYMTGQFSGTLSLSGSSGMLSLTSAGNVDAFFTKINTGTGGFDWALRAGGPGGDIATEIVEDSAGDLYATGYFQGSADFDGIPVTSNGAEDGFLAKIETSAPQKILWVRGFGSAGYDAAYGLGLDSSDNIYISGAFSNTVTFNSPQASADATDIFIAKLASGAQTGCYFCGNGLVDPGEQCDQGAANGQATSCCLANCQYRAAGSLCRSSAGECDFAETCSGASGSCPSDSKFPNATPCTDDGNECTLDRCNGSSNLCQHPNVANGTACTADAFPCTEDICLSGACSHPFYAAGVPCNDGLFCNGADTCNGTSGICANHAGNPCPGPDGDSNCAESCNEAADNCTLGDPAGSTCSDGQFCNGSDTCNGSGACSIHTGDPCPGPDGDSNCMESCNETTDTCNGNDPASSSCNDTLFCNGTDTCNGTGSCAIHTGDPCLASVGDNDSDCSESCNETTDACTANDPLASACNDGLFCNGPDTCNGSGVCFNHAGNPCPGPDGDNDCSEICDETADNCTLNDPNGSVCMGCASNPNCECRVGVCQNLCGNGTIETSAGEICDNALFNSNNSPCRTDCRNNFCGDGHRLTTLACTRDADCFAGSCISNLCSSMTLETCDEGALNGTLGHCRSDCTGTCGNSVIEVGEQCDDGNIANGDGCSNVCLGENIAVSFCLELRTNFVDEGFGEDYWSADVDGSGLPVYKKARGMRIRVWEEGIAEGANDAFYGYLNDGYQNDQDGCVAGVVVNGGKTYQLRIYSQSTIRGNNVFVMRDTTNPSRLFRTYLKMRI